MSAFCQDMPSSGGVVMHIVQDSLPQLLWDVGQTTTGIVLGRGEGWGQKLSLWTVTTFGSIHRKMHCDLKSSISFVSTCSMSVKSWFLPACRLWRYSSRAARHHAALWVFLCWNYAIRKSQEKLSQLLF